MGLRILCYFYQRTIPHRHKDYLYLVYIVLSDCNSTDCNSLSMHSDSNIALAHPTYTVTNEICCNIRLCFKEIFNWKILFPLCFCSLLAPSHFPLLFFCFNCASSAFCSRLLLTENNSSPLIAHSRD